MPKIIEQILKNENFSNNEIAIYLKILETGPVTARRLSDLLNIPRASIYDGVHALSKKGLVLEQEEGSKKVFVLDDFHNLSSLIREKIDYLQNLGSLFEQDLSVLQSRPSDPRRSKVKFFKGIDNVRTMLNGLLSYENTEVLAVYNLSAFFALIGAEYFFSFENRRFKKNISFRSIWPHEILADKDLMKTLSTQPPRLIRIKLAPKQFSWDVGFLICENKVYFMSSADEVIGVLIENSKIAGLMKTQFEMTWGLLKDVPLSKIKKSQMPA